MYSAIAQKQVDVISAYSTDGRIVDFDLMVLDDTNRPFLLTTRFCCYLNRPRKIQN